MHCEWCTAEWELDTNPRFKVRRHKGWCPEWAKLGNPPEVGDAPINESAAERVEADARVAYYRSQGYSPETIRHAEAIRLRKAPK